MYDLNKRAEELNKQIADGVTASNFDKSAEGKLVLEYINERVSSLLNKMTANTPLDDREYLEAHGRVSELKMINTMLQSKASGVTSAKEELDAITEQRDSESGSDNKA